VVFPKTAPAFGYIGGTSFSGSTLLSFLLNAQPGVTSTGEVAWSVPRKNPGNYPCSCGATLDTCQFWSDVTRLMQRKQLLFDADHWNTAFDVTANRWVRKIAVRSLGSNSVEEVRDYLVRKIPVWGTHLAEIGRRNRALFDSIVDITGAAAFVDASKDPVRVRLLREYCAIEPYVIHLVRDSPAFVNSAIKKDNSVRSFGVAIGWWNATARRMERLRRTTSPERWLLVRYEDLCTNPKAEIKRVLDFLGVAAVAPVLEFRSTSHHIIGNRMRLGDSSQIRLDSSWQTELSKIQLDQIVRSTMKYRQVLGYAGSERDP
jgi:hypothetical protein